MGFDRNCRYFTRYAPAGPILRGPCLIEHSDAQPGPDSFQPGDLVRLRSGGPAMTVDSVKGNQADCFWTGEDGQPNAERFPIDVLQKF